MNLIFSRKGFDSSAGGRPSPIVNGRALSLPIPENDIGGPTYEDLGRVEVEALTKGRIRITDTAHHDPCEHDGRVFLGQASAAQSHLANNGVGAGDIFLFFGLFRDYEAKKGAPNARPHHRIFGFLRVEKVFHLGNPPDPAKAPGVPGDHPHLHRGYYQNNTIYAGAGRLRAPASDLLRLSLPSGPLSHWQVPHWLGELGLTYHGNPALWGEGKLATVGKGQEFICRIPDGDHAAHDWLEERVQECMK